MTALPVPKRQYDAFLSHASNDKVIVRALYDWLTNTVQAKVWYDEIDLPLGGSIAASLPSAIEQCKTMIVVLSKSAVERGWVKREHDAAISHMADFPSFRVLPVRIDDVDPPGFLRNYRHIDLAPEGITGRAALDLLIALFSKGPDLVDQGGRDTYVSHGWHDSDMRVSLDICRALDNLGVRMIADSEDQESWSGDRVRSIVESCGAMVAVLPYRPHTPNKTSKYILQELKIAEELGLPTLTFSDSRITPAPDRATFEFNDAAWTGDTSSIISALRQLMDDWREPRRPCYAFYATDLNNDFEFGNYPVRKIVNMVAGIRCDIGQEIRESLVQEVISNRIANAAVVLADITGDRLNTCIEAGIARGAGAPLKLLAHTPARRPPFMFRDQQVFYYKDEAELFGKVARLAFDHRRRILNRELRDSRD